ncbi:hypothetical protein [Cytobacillus purgationiresistens]|uniref:Uncharacterized protein n=1 Tax=Cytobacillus purgationiresistens TaxID=863449 RepID=A0ABU0AHR0_9BACI|nr:hypothetical protein [Cytobacillus purgationiresistens]MDQ0270796.1 hypothetical protein [Cytobacillus purgationiresistens]
MAAPKPKPKDWRNRPIDDWLVATFQQYLKDAHVERYGIDYVARNYGMEGRNMKQMLAEHGPAVLRQFIDACFAEYKPTREYPGLNFAFMFTWQKARVLPRVLAEGKREKAQEARRKGQQADVSEEDLTDWL